VYALRIGIEVTNVSILLSAFAIGGIVTQLPLGVISDRIGRKNTLMAILFLGFLSFTAASFLEYSFLGLTLCIFIAGMFVGSTFSLGIGYMADLMPKNLLPTGNLMCGIFFSVGSLSGPFLGGLFIHFFQNISFFHIISTMLFLIFLLVVTFGEKSAVAMKQ
jgi:MFS family permease